jgi:cytochrome b involved in lipid metabolism
MNKKVVIPVIIVGVITIIAIIAINKNNNSITKTTNVNKNTVINVNKEDNSATTTTNNFTREEISRHNSKNDCWVSASGKVYNITQFLNKHKAPLEKYCGTIEEFENAYLGKHGHSKDNILDNFVIGKLTTN